MMQFFRLLLAVPLTLSAIEGAASAEPVGTAYEYSFQAIDETPLPMTTFRGKVVLVVNTASFCGFTHQYAGLEKLYETYRDRGLVVLGVPSNDFGDQEPGSNAEIAKFCQGSFNVTFPLTSKYDVVGAGAHPFYRWAQGVLGASNVPKWNFHKYLVGADGKLIASFATTVEPDAPKLIGAIETALAAAKHAGG